MRRHQYLFWMLGGAVLVLLGTVGLTQEPYEPKNVARSEHDPKIDSVLEQIFKLSEQGQAQAAAQAASQFRVPVSGNTAIVIFQVPESVNRDPAAQDLLKRQIAIMRGQVIATSKYAWKVQIPMSLGLLRAAIAAAGNVVQFVRPPLVPQTLVVSEGVALTGASNYHAMGFRGQGVKIAVIDLGFQGLSTAQSRGELPGGIQTFDYTNTSIESGTNHGTAVAEIIYDMAPQAQLILMKVSDEVDLENAKEEAIRQGAKIINHSVGWFNTNFYDGTGIINNIVADARSRGILWVNAAGNYARRHWQGTFRDTNNNKWHEFSGSDESLTITVNAGDQIGVFLTWNDWPGSGNDYDLHLFNNSGTQVAASQRIQSGTEPPVESLFYQSFIPGTFHIQIKADGTPAPRTFSLFSLNHDVEYPVPASSIIAPGDSPNALTVGAVNRQSWTTGPIAPYSSQGPTNAGLSKPDIVGPDRVSTFTYTEFPGTSAAAPHVAGAAALLLSENPSLTAGQLEARLKGDAIPMGSPVQFGSGRLNLTQASPPPGQPDLTVSGLTSSPSNPRVGDFVTVSGIVRNVGNANAGSFVIEIRDSGGTDRRTVAGLNAGGSTSFSFTRRVNQTSETFVVIADATNQVNESNENNNSAELRVTATQPTLKPDLAIAGTDWSPRTLTVGQNVTLSVVVRNQGQANAGAFVVEVRDSAGTDRQTLAGLAVGSTATVSFTRRVNNTTEFFTITVDATNQVDELDETNNSVQIRVDAQPQAPRRPDLIIAGVDWSPRTPRLGENVNFTVVVRNQGDGDAGPFIVEIRDSAGQDRRTVSGLGVTSSVSLSFTRRQNNTTEIFTITADVTNQVDESNETNNATQIRIDALAETRLPDLTVDSLDYSPRDPSVGSTLTLTAIVRNIGNADAGPFVVEVQDSAGTDRQTLSGLRAGASVRMDFSRRLNTTSETFTVTADALRQVQESNETNNSRQITVRGSTPSQLSIAISTDKTSYRIGERLQIFLRLGAQAYVYVFDVDPAGRVSQVFPNAFSRQNLLNAGTYTLPDGPYTLVINGPEGTEYLHAIAITQPVSLGLDGIQNRAWLDPEAFRAELTRRIQSAAPSATWTSAFTSFQVGTTAPPQNRAPTACFTFSPTNPVVNQAVTFDASCSTDPDGRIVRYDWDFDGDGRFDAQGVRVAFAFPQARTYTVLLRATDDQGLTGSQSQSVTVTATPPTPPPRPYIPLGAGGLFIIGTDKLYLMVQGATGWNSDRPYQISLAVNGTIVGVGVQTEGAATAQPVPQITGQQMQITLNGSVRSNGRVIYTVELSNTVSAARIELLLDVNGDGTPERTQTNTIFIFIPGIGRIPGFHLPLSNPFIIKNARNQSLLPFDEFTRLCVPAQATGFDTASCWPG
ncbi:MAG: S8 family serine peptidase [Candidatus Bipolaricaulota bacterium]|nr:S8 family serine peptidase [Candidatus Bipolaricaulota bacterium]